MGKEKDTIQRCAINLRRKHRANGDNVTREECVTECRRKMPRGTGASANKAIMQLQREQRERKTQFRQQGMQ